jgi:DsbC/DsbD-like thiol-disulfide interchange protein
MAFLRSRRNQGADGCAFAVHHAMPLLWIGLLAGTAPGGARAPAGSHGSVELIAQQPALRPGLPLWVGFHFKLEEGWHIYWINPGDSGEPPRVQWRLPEGFRAGPLHWPVPQRIEDHSLIDYGYLNEVLLPVEITPTAKPQSGPDMRLAATVNWLVCREICVPARADVSLTLPVRGHVEERPSAERRLFAREFAGLPRPLPKSWRVSATLDQHRFLLDIQAAKRESSALFFPLEQILIENAAPQKAIPSSRGVQLQLERSEQLLKAPLRLKGVLVLSNRGYNIDVPVSAAK